MRLWNEVEGQNLIEYALLVALIAILVAATFPAVAAAVTNQLKEVKDCLDNLSAHGHGRHGCGK